MTEWPRCRLLNKWNRYLLVQLLSGWTEVQSRKNTVSRKWPLEEDWGALCKLSELAADWGMFERRAVGWRV